MARLKGTAGYSQVPPDYIPKMPEVLRRTKYPDDFKRKALEMSEQMSIKAASAKLGIRRNTLSYWRAEARNQDIPLAIKKVGRNPTPRPIYNPPPMAEVTPPKDNNISRMIADAIEKALKPEYSLYDMGDNGEVTPEAVQLTRERLRAFPDVCLQAQEVEGVEAMMLNYEIRTVKNALTGISGDPYYQIVPDLYFHHLTNRQVSFRANCDMATVWRNEQRLLYDLAFMIYGVRARWRHPFFALKPSTQPEK